MRRFSFGYLHSARVWSEPGKCRSVPDEDDVAQPQWSPSGKDSIPELTRGTMMGAATAMLPHRLCQPVPYESIDPFRAKRGRAEGAFSRDVIP